MAERRIDWPAHRARAHQIGQLQQGLKQIVYGGNDGIVTTFVIVAGFAGASAEGAGGLGVLAVLVFGLANLFADATSMGLGEFLSTRSQRDVYMARRRREMHELETNPAQERRELVQMLRERGLSPDEAETAADHLMKSPELVVDMMMTYEMAMPDMRSATPAIDGLVTFASFALFGVIPLLPYLVLPAATPAALELSVAATALALVGLGLLRWKATDETLVRCVGETLLVGGACAGVAFVVGALVAG